MLLFLRLGRRCGVVFFCVAMAAVLALGGKLWAAPECCAMVDADKKGWFSAGDLLGEITPLQAPSESGCRVVLRGKSFELSHRVNQVLSDGQACILVGGGMVSAIKVKPEIEFLATRPVPLLGTAERRLSVRLIDNQVLCVSPGTRSAWTWDPYINKEWMIRSAWLDSYMGVIIKNEVLLVESEKLLAVDGRDTRTVIEKYEFTQVPTYLYQSDRRLVMMYGWQGLVIYDVEKMDGSEIKVTARKAYKGICPPGAAFTALSNGDTLILQVWDNYLLKMHLIEVDVAHEQYREIVRDATGLDYKELFMYQGDFYSTSDMKQGPVFKGDGLKKAQWMRMEELKREGLEPSREGKGGGQERL